MTYLAPVAPPVPVPSSDPAPAILAVAEALLPDLAQGFQIDALRLRLEMERAFGGSDADGAWDWKLAYEAGEVALVLFLRKFGRALLARAGSPAALLPIIAKVAGLFPTHTRRSEEMERFQQFSTPLPMGLAALTAAQITPRDLVLEPSAGTGLLAILAEIAGGSLALNELADTRADLLRLLFPGHPVTTFDAAQIDDHLDVGVRPSVILMNPPFSAVANVDGRTTEATARHLRSALARLGDMDLARGYLRPGDPSGVQLLEAKGGDAELLLQLRGYVSGDKDERTASAAQQISKHLFTNLRGTDNLVFAGSRQSVEIYADHLRSLCEEERLPQEFYPHHASLSRDHRDFVERRLKDRSKPTTAVCTSTLELGIDIGDVTCVAQIGAPFSVASLRQRLGRSGRRAGQPAILRQYAVEAALTNQSSYVDRLRLGLVRSVAMIDLLLEGWCEPPRPEALHLSTLVHQILSVIAERGGASAGRLYRVLCQEGPFKRVDTPTFMDVLRALGQPDTGLIEQSDDGMLLLGRVGEKLVEHYSFYAVFQTPEEYRLISGGKELGTLPIVNVMAPGMMLIFSGRRWVIQDIDDQDKVIMVVPSKGGTPPVFGGDPGDIHDHVIERMFTVLESEDKRLYADKAARDLLDEARREYAKLGFATASIIPLGETSSSVATRVGTVKTTTLALALRAKGFEIDVYDGFLTVSSKDGKVDLRAALKDIASGEPVNLFADQTNLIFEKFHTYLYRDLLERDALASKVDLASLPKLCQQILGH